MDKVIQKTVEPVILLHEHFYNSDIMYVSEKSPVSVTTFMNVLSNSN
jgi:hypothetical protein